MKMTLQVKDIIVDADVAMQVMELLANAEAIYKPYNKETYTFTNVDYEKLSISPINMSRYAEAVLNRDSDD